MKKLIKNYTTDVPAEKTIAEIQQLLVENGATGIATEYEDGILSKLFFRIKIGDKELPFRLPAKPDNVYKTLFKGMLQENRYKKERMSKATNIAWRVCKLWLEAQLTHINLEQAEFTEVFLPYMVMRDNKTMFEQVKENDFLLPSGN